MRPPPAEVDADGMVKRAFGLLLVLAWIAGLLYAVPADAHALTAVLGA